MPGPTQTIVNLVVLAMVANLPIFGIALAFGVQIPIWMFSAACLTALSAFVAMLRAWTVRPQVSDTQSWVQDDRRRFDSTRSVPAATWVI